MLIAWNVDKFTGKKEKLYIKSCMALNKPFTWYALYKIEGEAHQQIDEGFRSKKDLISYLKDKFSKVPFTWSENQEKYI